MIRSSKITTATARTTSYAVLGFQHHHLQSHSRPTFQKHQQSQHLSLAFHTTIKPNKIPHSLPVLNNIAKQNNDNHYNNINNSGRNDNRNITWIENELDGIQNEANRLNDYSYLNLNSPKQISNLLYKQYNDDTSTAKGTGKVVLQAFANYENDIPPPAEQQQQQQRENALFQKELATLVLQYRELKQTMQASQKQNNNPTDNNNYESRNSRHTSTLVSSRSLSTNVSTTATTKEKNNNDTTIIKNKSNEHSIISTHEHHHKTNTAYDDMITHLFTSSKLNPYWSDTIQSLTKPSARAIVPQLNPSCPMGYDPGATPSTVSNMGIINGGKKTTNAGQPGSLLNFVRKERMKHSKENSDCIILTRVGEFYESFGIDALLLMEYCGLNSMAGKARAGMPIKNIQAALDCLTSAGFRVAVYEEVTDIRGRGVATGPKLRIKQRMLAQIISPASPTYMYNLVLGDSGNTGDTLFGTPSARPYVGIIANAAGYTLVEVFSEERTVRVSDRLTAEAIACRLSAYPPAEPLLYVSPPGDKSRSLPFIPSYKDKDQCGPGARYNVVSLPHDLHMPSPQEGLSEIERSKQCIVSALLQRMEIHPVKRNDDDYDVQLSRDDFTLLNTLEQSQARDSIRTNPLYLETATQLGLMNGTLLYYRY